MRDVQSIANKMHSSERRTHAACTDALGSLIHAKIGGFNGAAQRFIGRCALGVEYLKELIKGKGAGELAVRVPAHAIRNRVKQATLKDWEAFRQAKCILIFLAHRADVTERAVCNFR